MQKESKNEVKADKKTYHSTKWEACSQKRIRAHLGVYLKTTWKIKTAIGSIKGTINFKLRHD